LIIIIFKSTAFAVDGDLGSNFGDQGIAITDINNQFDLANAIAVDGRNNVIVAGRNGAFLPSAGTANLAIIRYINTPQLHTTAQGAEPTLLMPGDFDPSFNPNGEIPGIVTTSIGRFAQATGIVTDYQDRIIVCGTTT